jgi:hypothetical protein
MNMNNDQGKHWYTKGSRDESLECTGGKTKEDRIKAKESKTRRCYGHVSRMNEEFQRRF